MLYQVRGNSVRFAAGREAKFDRPVLEALDIGSVLVVVLDPSGLECLPENVYGLDPSGRVSWRVQEFEFAHGRPPYSGVTSTPAGLILYNRSGVEVLIDAATGRILRTEFTR